MILVRVQVRECGERVRKRGGERGGERGEVPLKGRERGGGGEREREGREITKKRRGQRRNFSLRVPDDMQLVLIPSHNL